MTSASPRVLAFYLPQFHPIPENDRWWGHGFTEWTNVNAATPLFRRHDQPRVPTDLGFYDLRDADAREAQARLAERYGIYGFCYWHYWFHGQRLLEQPFDAVLQSGRPDLPFALAWANESWSRRWLGEDRDILKAQTYSPEDDRAHAKWLARTFADPRYVRVGDRPLFLVYRPADLPDPIGTTKTLRGISRAEGLGDPYLVGIDAHCTHVDCRTLGFDDTLRFEPQLGVLPDFAQDGTSFTRLVRNLRAGVFNARVKVYDEGQARALMAARQPSWPTLPSVFVRWDNTPRRGRDAIVMVGGGPKRFEAALTTALEAVRERPPHERLVFLNAWNEWAEGNHLEPDARFGLSYLEAVKRACFGL